MTATVTCSTCRRPYDDHTQLDSGAYVCPSYGEPTDQATAIERIRAMRHQLKERQ